MQRLPGNLPDLFKLRKRTLLGFSYLTLTLAFPLAGAAYFLAPQAISCCEIISAISLLRAARCAVAAKCCVACMSI